VTGKIIHYSDAYVKRNHVYVAIKVSAWYVFLWSLVPSSGTKCVENQGKNRKTFQTKYRPVFGIFVLRQ
jgi:hypothetical protein